jgi:DNA (cytosine-5)-methyltransferase 1
MVDACARVEHPFASKNRAVGLYLCFVQLLQPRFGVLENVPGMLNYWGGEVTRLLVKQLISWDYQVRIHVACAAGYGVPQKRWRVFVVYAKRGELLPEYILTFVPCEHHNDALLTI